MTFTRIFITIFAIVLLSGCAAQSAETTREVVYRPTLTPYIITPTFTPPPTVTSFPTRDVTDKTMTAASGPTEAAIASGSPTPSQAATQMEEIASEQQSLFFADFSTGWPEVQEGSISTRLIDGKYQFMAGPLSTIFIATTSLNQESYYAELTATVEQCPPGGGYGLMFNFFGSGNYYLYTIHCDNSYSLARWLNGERFEFELGDPYLPASLLASQGDHVIAVQADQGVFSLIFDEVILATIADDRIPGGDIALFATSLGEGTMIVAFDDLYVYEVR